LVQQIVGQVLASAQPERIILFGSRARVEANPRSDFDLLVIQPSNQPRYRRAGPIYRALASLPAEVDVVVYTPEEVEEWRSVPEAFVTTAIREGKVLYERPG
jgi:predicted nucleotidyltransferase